MRWIIIAALLLGTAVGQFKTELQRDLEEILMAPCCGSGTLAEHDDNQYTIKMKQIMNAITAENLDMNKVKKLFTETYSNRGIYSLGFSPATMPLPQIMAEVDRRVHPGMSKDEIVDLFSAIHTERIRSMPKNEGLGYLAWKMPIAILLIGIIIATIIVRALVKATGSAPAGNSELVNFNPELTEKIEQEMKELDI